MNTAVSGVSNGVSVLTGNLVPQTGSYDGVLTSERRLHLFRGKTRSLLPPPITRSVPPPQY